MDEFSKTDALHGAHYSSRQGNRIRIFRGHKGFLAGSCQVPRGS